MRTGPYSSMVTHCPYVWAGHELSRQRDGPAARRPAADHCASGHPDQRLAGKRSAWTGWDPGASSSRSPGTRLLVWQHSAEAGSIAVLGHAGQVLGGTADDVLRPAARGEVAGAPVRGDAGRGG